MSRELWDIAGKEAKQEAMKVLKKNVFKHLLALQDCYFVSVLPSTLLSLSQWA